MNDVRPTPAPGWYPNPSGSGQRWWNGNSWTQNVAPAQLPREGAGGRREPRDVGMSNVPLAPAPDWYPNPSGGGQRWWNGSSWTEHVAPAQSLQQRADGRREPFKVKPWMWVTGGVAAIGLVASLILIGLTVPSGLGFSRDVQDEYLAYCLEVGVSQSSCECYLEESAEVMSEEEFISGNPAVFNLPADSAISEEYADNWLTIAATCSDY